LQYKGETKAILDIYVTGNPQDSHDLTQQPTYNILTTMSLIEKGKIVFNNTIGSEKFEKYSRSPLGIAICLLGVYLGPQAMIEAVNLIKQGHIAEGIVAGTQGTLELGIAASIAYVNTRAVLRARSNRRNRTTNS